MNDRCSALAWVSAEAHAKVSGLFLISAQRLAAQALNISIV